MAEIVVTGGGVGGLCTALLLARDGHRVTVLERDGADPVPGDPAWDTWERPGVKQFKMLHFFSPRFRETIEAEVPEVLAELAAIGARRFNPLADAPEAMRGPLRPGDERFDIVTARRPVMEAALAAVAARTEGLTVRRGVDVAGLVTDGTSDTAGGPVPHVVGVRLAGGEELRADLVVDATGRRSGLPRMLAEIGAAAPAEEMEDSGFVYYARHFHSPTGEMPYAMGGLLQPYGSISILTLPADNGCWGVGIIAVAGDAELRGLKDTERWTAAVRAFPLVAHWLDGDPIDDDVKIMAKLEDRIRRFVVDGSPVATGIAPVADSWACTNPSLGRGACIGLLHAVALRDTLRKEDPADPTGFALAWDAATAATVEPWYRATVAFDRHRLAEAAAVARGEAYEPDDPTWAITKALELGSTQDPDLFRAFLSVVGMLRLPEEALGAEGAFEKVLAIGDAWRDQQIIGPDRAGLVALATS